MQHSNNIIQERPGPIRPSTPHQGHFGPMFPPHGNFQIPGLPRFMSYQKILAINLRQNGLQCIYLYSIILCNQMKCNFFSHFEVVAISLIYQYFTLMKAPIYLYFTWRLLSLYVALGPNMVLQAMYPTLSPQQVMQAQQVPHQLVMQQAGIPPPPTPPAPSAPSAPLPQGPHQPHQPPLSASQPLQSTSAGQIHYPNASYRSYSAPLPMQNVCFVVLVYCIYHLGYMILLHIM